MASPRRWVSALKLTTTVLLVSLLLSRLDWSRAESAVESMQLRWLVAAAVVFLTTSLAESLRLRIVFGYLRLRYWDAYKLQAIGFFWASFLPGQVGGDLYRLMVVRSVGGSISQTVAALAALRAISLLVVIASAVIGVVLVLPQRHLWEDSFAVSDAAWASDSIVIGLALSASLLAGAAIAYFARRYASHPRGKNTLDMLRLAVSRLSWPRLLALLFISIGVQALRVLLMSLLVRSLGFELRADHLLFVTSAAVFANHIPISFGGLGTREAAIVMLLLPLGVPYEEGTLVAVAGRCISMVFALWGGVLFLIFRHKGKISPEIENADVA